MGAKAKTMTLAPVAALSKFGWTAATNHAFDKEKRDDINTQVAQASAMVNYVDVKDAKKVNDTCAKMLTTAKQNALDGSQRKKCAGQRFSFGKNSFLLATLWRQRKVNLCLAA